MSDDVLRGLLEAYVGGDLLARRALLDFLEEVGDRRLEAVRQEAIDWNAVARELCPTTGTTPAYRYYRKAGGEDVDDPELPRYRYFVDCARYGAGATPEVVRAVREARRAWLGKLFPEVEL
jgi:hypothetical protein